MKQIFEEYVFPHGKVMKNRLVMAPMTTYSSNEDLTFSDEEELYYKSRSNDIGMVITAATAISKNAQAFPYQISIRDGRYLDSMKRLRKAIKHNGSLAVLQLHHGGRMNQPNLYHNQDIVSASAVKANRDYAVTPRELRTSEVYDIIDDFVNATRLAIKAGFDGVELHGANTYLIQQFFSPHSNQRDDEFGPTLEKRLYLPRILIERINNLKREMNEPSFIVGYRFSPEEYENPGITLGDTMYLVDNLASKDIDYLHVSLGHYKQSSIRSKEDLEPIVAKLIQIIGNRVPLIGVGQIETQDNINDAYKLGYSLTAHGLILLSDPNFVVKIKNNELPTKIISEKSMLPTKLFERLKGWRNLGNRNYIIK